MIIYAILFILAIHYSFPAIVLWLCAFGFCCEIAKKILERCQELLEDVE